MENNKEFWKNYLKTLKKEIQTLCRRNRSLKIDLHLHSNYSADGKQTVKEILESTKSKGFDIIAITDHDSIEVYNEVYEFVKKGLTKPLIIPGIEFTMDNREYGNQCHILQLFINPKDETLLRDVDKNYEAMYNRSKIQFKRLKENITITKILKENKLKISYSEYLNYLYKNEMVPEYDTLCNYLMEKFKSKKITTFDILTNLEKDNELDPYEDRKEYKNKRYRKLRGKYTEEQSNYYNVRLLLSMLAVREVDDDWWDKPSSGSLSVNSYGQLKINELNNKFVTIFAHPTESSIEVVRNILKTKKSIIGLERNIRNEYKNIETFNNLLKEKKLIEIKGSDSHDNSLKLYEDMNYYRINSSELERLIKEDKYE